MKKFIMFLVLWFNIDYGVIGQNQTECHISRCRSDGPVVRFPFRIIGIQPLHCGYPDDWFSLSCTEHSETVMELLPSSAVKLINYETQMIYVMDTQASILKWLLNITANHMPFRFVGQKKVNVSLFNCSSGYAKVGYYGWYLSGLSADPYRILAKISSASIRDSNLTSCTKIRDLFSVPPSYMNSIDHYASHYGRYSPVQLHWSNPICKSCEAKQKYCRMETNATLSQIQCYGTVPKSTEDVIATSNKSYRGESTKHKPRDAIDTSGHAGDSKKRAARDATLGATLGLVLVVVATILAYRKYSSNKIEKEYEIKIEMFLQHYTTFKPTRYSYADIKRITNQFKDQLGQGAYGTVFRGKLSDEISVAVKVLNNSNENGEEFINEVGAIGRIHHVNVVRLVGFCADGFRRALIYEYLPNDTLHKFISSNNHNLGWKRQKDITIGIAKGIEYLHQGCDQRILHFDIKPQNILLDNDFNPKVADFGLAKLCAKDQSAVSMTTARGTVGYIAPEVFSRNFGNVSYKSDVYSFGMVVLEMVGGRKIVEATTDENDEKIYFPEWIYHLLEEGEELRLVTEEEEDAKIAKKLAIVGLWCIQWNPIDRPSMKTVIHMLEEEDENISIPPNPFSSITPSRMNGRIRPARRIHQELGVISETE
ncbi:rust resistance kinase Lr10-like [Mercurialis annua]|uniref:rust resistance kinase Lr10-like n=1 Tax=Mercurialis annua TaxID=3986 RepID=UPI002160BD61|nr:rust resistance kinase Lr10-like [Mercurialis annua]